MGLWGDLGGLVGGVIGIGEKITGFDIPGIGPGDKYFGGASNGTQSPYAGRSCRPPYTLHPTTGRCTLTGERETGVSNGVYRGLENGTQVGTRPAEGWKAAFERFFPGGATGTELATEGYGAAVIGAFGIPALEPAIVGAVQRRDGTMAPIRRCPPGLVLATDELCYAKGTKGLAAHRKWKPSGACFLPPRDVKALRRAVAIRKSKSNRAMFRELGLG